MGKIDFPLLSAKIIVVICFIAVGLIDISRYNSAQPIQAQKDESVQQVLGDNTAIPIQVDIEASPSATPNPNTITIADRLFVDENTSLDAWWSVMESEGSIIATISSLNPISCEFMLTTIGEKNLKIKKSIPLGSEYCTFKAKQPEDIYLLWGRAANEDGKIREFGNKQL